ncbi:ribosomal L1 domain-containing protein 1-like [Acropora muricata]|uniref:ribosomal L1 domain-containing protein 1-like n=1 Tax=Acropora muricata TaxID=159855 RepID=UPI0034E5B7C4
MEKRKEALSASDESELGDNSAKGDNHETKVLVRSCTNLGNISVLTEYVEEIFQEYLSSSKDELEEAARKLKNMNPAPMNTMLQKQPREEAIEKRIKRSKMVVEDVPPTTPLAPDQPVEPTTSNKGKGKKRKRKTPSERPDQPVPATTGRRKKRKQETSCVGPKKPRHCSLCKNPTKGHKNVKNCPRNKKK